MNSPLRIALFSHIRPDGDTLGAMFALRRVCLAAGATVLCRCDDALPKDLSYLDPDGAFNAPDDGAPLDVAVALDCADPERLGRFQPLFFSAATTYNIDHHLGNPDYATYNRVRESASTCEILYDLLVEAGYAIDDAAALALYTGIVTDTGGFSQSNVTAHSFSTAAALLAHGIDVEWLSNRLFKSQSKAKLQLIGTCIDSMRFYRDDRIALICVTKEMLDRFGLLPAETDGLVLQAMSVDTVAIACCLTEYGKENFKVSLRCRRGWNVRNVAAAFGGGGHVQAAGCSVRAVAEEAIEQLVRQCEIALDSAK